MRDINLQKINQEIEWNRKDEIGELVNEYNKMVHKLDESAEALAKSEREGAWRQMAKQVAHEIKNPLTPMKLSIQYLQKAIDNNSPQVKEMTANVAKTLIEQIDHLSKIASDFSQFANIGNPRNEVFDLHELRYRRDTSTTTPLCHRTPGSQPTNSIGDNGLQPGSRRQSQIRSRSIQRCLRTSHVRGNCFHGRRQYGRWCNR